MHIFIIFILMHILGRQYAILPMFFTLNPNSNTKQKVLFLVEHDL